MYRYRTIKSSAYLRLEGPTCRRLRRNSGDWDSRSPVEWFLLENIVLRRSAISYLIALNPHHALFKVR